DEPWVDELADLAISFHGRKEFNRKTGLTFLRFIVQAIAKIPDHLLNQEITDPRFKTMLSLMQKNFRHPLTNEELAQEINMSTRAMIRTFKGIFGCTPQAFYLRLRLEHALLLLEFSQHSIEVIAEQCGFCDRNYFSTAFKRHFAISPAAYRRKNRFHV
ncbi:MAG: helix-turn-helix domain-containing protein, partial [Lentisphaerae bacterium]